MGLKKNDMTEIKKRTFLVLFLVKELQILSCIALNYNVIQFSFCMNSTTMVYKLVWYNIISEL